MTAEHVVNVRARKKRPVMRCKGQQCAQLTRHRTQLCPVHRRNGTATA